MRRALTAGFTLVGLLALACLGGDDDVDLTLLLTATPTPTPTTVASPTVTATPTPTPTPAAIATAGPTATAAATPVPAPTPTPSPDDLTGLPFSTHDVRLAVEGAGYTFWTADREGFRDLLPDPFCRETAVPGLSFWSANKQGSDFGPVYVLWVYPDIEALRADWDATHGERPELLVEGCELPYGFVWWNANAVMAFQAFLGPGGLGGLGSSVDGPADFPAVPAFLGLGP